VSVFIIGEAGSCHEGDLDKCRQLIDVAADAGCSAVKFQYWSSPRQMQLRRNIPAPAYDTGSIKPEWFPELRTWSHSAGLQFMCTVYLPEDVEFVDTYVDRHKISSFECLDRILLEKVKQTGKIFYVSLGMTDIAERSKVRNLVNSNAILMHCVSAYPCPKLQASLGRIERGMGYSDHTGYFATGSLAVAAGAMDLEVHFRLWDTEPTCPDYPVALNPSHLECYVALAKEAYQMRFGSSTLEDNNRNHRVVR